MDFLLVAPYICQVRDLLSDVLWMLAEGVNGRDVVGVENEQSKMDSKYLQNIWSAYLFYFVCVMTTLL